MGFTRSWSLLTVPNKSSPRHAIVSSCKSSGYHCFVGQAFREGEGGERGIKETERVLVSAELGWRGELKVFLGFPSRLALPPKRLAWGG